MAINKESTPPPVIGKIGPYTVFMTPPSTPKPSDAVVDSPKKIVPPPVQPPPVQMEKPLSGKSVVDGSVLGFFKNAVTKVQNGTYLAFFAMPLSLFDVVCRQRSRKVKWGKIV